MNRAAASIRVLN